MGNKTSREIYNENIREKNKKQIEDIYCMFDQTVVAVRKSKIICSQLNTSPRFNYSSIKISKISNLQSVLEQLLESFQQKSKYIWGKDVPKMFVKHFQRIFEQIWPINKEEFYKLVLSSCSFETLDFQKELQELSSSIDMSDISSPPRRLSYEKYFYEVGKKKIQQRLPSSFIGEQIPWEQSFRHQTQSQQQQFNMNAINATIISEYGENGLKQSEDFDLESREIDFLPLFIQKNKDGITKISENKMIQKEDGYQILRQSFQSNKSQMINNDRIQNSSLIAPETVFYERMTRQNKAEINDLVKFYRQFANALQQMFSSSTSIISAPYKHFIFCLKQKMQRKNIKLHNKQQKSQNKLQNNSEYKTEKLLYSQTEQGNRFRLRREFNNNLLLTEIKQFAEAYTDFVWMFLELNQISESKLGKLINIYTLYGIVIKSIWKYVEWISGRGCQYEERTIQDYYRHRPTPNHTKIPEQKKNTLFQILMKLRGETNPQKYLKKIVVFYRQSNKHSTCADDLLNIYEQLAIRLIKCGLVKQTALFRMPKIIERLLRLQQSLSSAGEISYSWTSWCILIEMLKEKITGRVEKRAVNGSQMITEPDWDEVMVDESPNSIN